MSKISGRLFERSEDGAGSKDKAGRGYDCWGPSPLGRALPGKGVTERPRRMTFDVAVDHGPTGVWESGSWRSQIRMGAPRLWMTRMSPRHSSWRCLLQELTLCSGWLFPGRPCPGRRNRARDPDSPGTMSHRHLKRH